MFINTRVELTVEGSPVVEDLQGLEQRGVGILFCGSCPDHIALKQTAAAEGIPHMYTIGETILRAGKVVS